MTVRRTTVVSDRVRQDTAYCGRWCTLEEFLLELSLGDLNLDRLIHLLVVSSLVVGIVLDGGGKECVDESRLSEPRLSGNLRQSAMIREL
jgi:hypothetical protein